MIKNFRLHVKDYKVKTPIYRTATNLQ